MILILNVALSLGVITAVVGGLAASIFRERPTHPQRAPHRPKSRSMSEAQAATGAP